MITKAPIRRFLFQNRQAAAAATAAEPASAPAPTPSLAPLFARFSAAFDRIAASLDEIRAGLDRVATVLEQMPLDLEVATETPADNAARPPRKRRAAVAVDSPDPDPVQEMLPLLFS